MPRQPVALISTKGKTSREVAEQLIRATEQFRRAQNQPLPQPEPKPPAA